MPSSTSIQPADTPPPISIRPGTYLLYCDFESAPRDVTSLFMADTEGKVVGTLLADACSAAVSPTGRLVAISAENDDGDQVITILDTTTGGLHQLPRSGGCSDPSWSPDEKWLVASCEGGLAITVLSLSEAPDLSLTCLGPSRGTCLNPAWSPDGTTIAYFEINAPYPGSGLILLEAACMNNPASCADSETYAGEFNPPYAWSPDSSTLAALQVNPSGGDANLVLLSISGHSIAAISTIPVHDPVYWSWSPDGGQLAVSRADHPISLLLLADMSLRDLPLSPFFPQVQWMTVSR